MPIVRQSPEVVLFDLGGVLIQLSGATWIQELSGIDTEEEIWRRWLSCPWVRSFESGCCSPDEFAVGIVQEWGLRTDAAGFLEAFRGLPVGPFDGAGELIAEVAVSRQVGCLSNTNALHWSDQMAWGLYDLLHHRFLSHELGVVKPDREVYEMVMAELDVPADRVLFLDDNLINVTAAREAGLHAEHVKGLEQARSALAAHGVLA